MPAFSSEFSHKSNLLKVYQRIANRRKRNNPMVLQKIMHP